MVLVKMCGKWKKKSIKKPKYWTWNEIKQERVQNKWKIMDEWKRKIKIKRITAQNRIFKQDKLCMCACLWTVIDDWVNVVAEFLYYSLQMEVWFWKRIWKIPNEQWFLVIFHLVCLFIQSSKFWTLCNVMELWYKSKTKHVK